MIQQALLTQFAVNGWAAGVNLDGVTHEESLVRPGSGGNPLNWVFGHLIDARTAALALLGEKPVWNERERALYGTGSEPLAPGWKPLALDELGARHAESQERLMRALEAAAPATFERQVPKVFEPQTKEPAGVQLAFLSFHETYHVGQLGLLRRLLGKPTAIGAPRR